MLPRTTSDQTRLASRVVDAQQHGWMLTAETPEELASTHGPLRPVLPMSDWDGRLLDSALSAARPESRVLGRGSRSTGL